MSVASRSVVVRLYCISFLENCALTTVLSRIRCVMLIVHMSFVTLKYRACSVEQGKVHEMNNNLLRNKKKPRVQQCLECTYTPCLRQWRLASSVRWLGGVFKQWLSLKLWPFTINTGHTCGLPIWWEDVHLLCRLCLLFSLTLDFSLPSRINRHAGFLLWS